MNVLIAVHHFLPRYHGGAEWRAYRTARELARRGQQIHLLTVESIGEDRDESEEHTKYDGLDVPRLYYDLATAPEPFRWSYRNPIVSRAARRLIDRFEPDVLHLIGGYMMSGSVVEVAREARVPVVLTLTDFWFMCPRITMVTADGQLCDYPDTPHECALCLLAQQRRYRWPARLAPKAWRWGQALLQQIDERLQLTAVSRMNALIRERRQYLRQILDEVDIVISPSQFLQRFFAERGYCVEQSRFIRQGLEINHWANAEWEADDRHLRIGYIGQIAPHKGVDLLCDAFRRLRANHRHPTLTLYGDTGKHPQFVRQVTREVDGHVDITFAGTFPNHQIKTIHAGLDVLVVPSTWYENSPTVILRHLAPHAGNRLEPRRHGRTGET